MKHIGLAMVAVIAGACALLPRGVEVTSASLVQGDEQRLGLEVQTCNADHRVDVEETDTEVTVTITARNDTRDDCQDVVEVRLQAPLAGRPLIDAATGQVINVDGNA